MRSSIVALALLAAEPAAAQTLSVQPGPYQSAPWWMREPIIASLGEVRAEVPANRARLSVSFESVGANGGGRHAAVGGKGAGC